MSADILLSHSLLAALPVNEIVTTNYDTLFEMACQGVNRELAILPYQPNAAKRRWLLKLHGSVGQGDIVLTRDDYLHLAHLRGALAGIVQALLVTRHLLFVGYSLSDDDFHQIVYDVRTAVHGGAGYRAPLRVRYRAAAVGRPIAHRVVGTRYQLRREAQRQRRCRRRVGA